MFTSPVTRAAPACLIFVLDLSESMARPGPDGQRLDVALTDLVNATLANLTLTCADSSGIRDYVHVAALGYRHVGPTRPDTLDLLEPLALTSPTPLSQLAAANTPLHDMQIRLPDGTTQTATIPTWITAVGSGKTPTRAGLTAAAQLAAVWASQHPDGHPPAVLHVTDGEANVGGDPTSAAQRLRSVTTSRGATLLMTAHLDPYGHTPAGTFPDSTEGLTDFGAALWHQSSAAPPAMRAAANERYGLRLPDGARAMMAGASWTDLSMFLDLGTRTATPTLATH